MKFFSDAAAATPAITLPPARRGARAYAIARVQNRFVAMDPKGDAENLSKGHQ
jgi:hypothetical protein